MPTYEYLCEACDHRFELFQSITADPVRVCPELRTAESTPAHWSRGGYSFQGFRVLSDGLPQRVVQESCGCGEVRRFLRRKRRHLRRQKREERKIQEQSGSIEPWKTGGRRQSGVGKRQFLG